MEDSLIRCIASTIARIWSRLRSASSAYFLASAWDFWRSAAVCSTLAVISAMVAWSSSTAPACSVAPSARDCAASAILPDPMDTCSAVSSTWWRESLILRFMLRIPIRRSLNFPVYLSSWSVAIAKLPSAISFKSLPLSEMITFRLSAISLAISIISATSSFASYSGNSLSRSPSANVFRRSDIWRNGFAIPSEIWFPNLLPIKMERIITAIITITTIISITARIASSWSPFWILISIRFFRSL